MDKILIIDALNFIYRGNIKFGQAQKAEYVVVYNFFRNLRATIEQFNPDKIFLCVEGGSNFRFKLFPTYKANRIKTGSKLEAQKEFNQQRDIILKLVSLLPITVVKADEFEADDVAATLIENMKDESIILISSDSDFTQLLQKGYLNLKIYNPTKKEFVVNPEHPYLILKSLRGDKSDNIPGLVGAKTAEKLIADIDKLKEFLSLEENRANFSLNKNLIELKIIDDDKLEFTNYETNFDILREEFVKMEFNSMLEEPYWKRFCDTFSKIT